MNVFSDLGIDPVIGTKLMRCVGISVDDLSNLQNFSMVRDIMAFFGGKSDAEFILTKLTKSRHVTNPLEHVWGYVETRKQLDDSRKAQFELKTKLDEYTKIFGENNMTQIKADYDSMTDKVTLLEKQASYYE